MSVMATGSMYIGAVMLTLFVMVIVNHLAASSCTQLKKTIGDRRRELDALENERLREQARWDGMTTPQRLDAALLRHGMKMRDPDPARQIVRLSRATGQPIRCQASVEIARARAASVTSQTARYDGGRGAIRR